jgi:hypothetical protein
MVLDRRRGLQGDLRRSLGGADEVGNLVFAALVYGARHEQFGSGPTPSSDRDFCAASECAGQSMRSINGAPLRERGKVRIGEEPHLAHVSDAALEQLCARPDAPAWVIAPAKVMKDAQLSVRRWSPSYWRAPRPEQWFEWDG